MDAITTEALTGLNTTIGDLFEGLATAPAVEITPLRVTTTGMNGFLAVHDDPVGDIYGRQIEAAVRATVTDNQPDDLNEAAIAVQGAVLGLSREERRQRGILRLTVDDSPEPPANANQRVFAFRVIYEFVKLPEDGGDIIEEIVYNIANG